MENSIGKRIADLRKYNGLTQMQLAEKLHISDKAVSKWESGGGDPSIELLCSLADIFNCSIDYIVRGNNPNMYLGMARKSIFKSDVEAEQIYNQAIDYIKSEVTALVYELAIVTLKPIRIDGEMFVFSVPSFNVKDYIKKSCYDILLKLLQKVNFKIKNIHILVENISTELYLKEAICRCIKNNKVSASFLQRELSIGYPTAFELLVSMEQMGFVSTPKENGLREILIDSKKFDKILKKQDNNLN